MVAARKGDVEYLLRSTESDPNLLEVVLIDGEETPLHAASMYGHLSFIKEILKLRESLGRELNKDGFIPLHIAAAMGHVEIARELLEKLSGEICLIKGKERRIPLITLL
ncbi:ankyrin repeat-containing protein BDA1 [Eutrema salsugineum]|uniref:ankyrin repeat-containing protein BDA1 n=1 Tax=Eutrema salsugineum TaxID=72664 RepID=UPI000CED02F5|nr:ankyrin repeat-containing protein BDA1 [Eutrema salsugineum]